MNKTTNCISCNIETNNPKFCSRSCAAKYNNVHFPKRKGEVICYKCGNTSLKSRKYCKEHNPQKGLDWSSISLEETNSKRQYQRNSRIRDLARRTYDKANLPKSCFICGYDKHYEIHHIKQINEFDKSTVISVINSLDNLVALCPTHHWEADRGMIVFTADT